MRSLVAVTKLRDVSVHAFQDRFGYRQITGVTLCGALLIPTRKFWLQLAQVAWGNADALENEFELMLDCIETMGHKELYFSISVDEQNNALLDGVTEDPGAPEESSVPTHEAQLDRRDVQELAAFRETFFERLEETGTVNPSEDVESIDTVNEENANEKQAGVSAHDWPLLAASVEPNESLYGWDNFLSLPSAALWLVEGPKGTLRFSRN